MSSVDVTILLPVYKEPDDYIIKSVDSILNQTFSQFKLLIALDDPKNDRIVRLLEKLKKKDERIEYYINDKNLGLPKSLNRMLDRVDTKYIARMDADDISLGNRLAIQFEYMETNPNVDLCGTNIIYIDKDGKEIFRKGHLPSNERIIRKSLKYIDVFCHPTFFAKASVIKKVRYRDIHFAEDYDLICRLVEQDYKITNIDKYLLKYRQGSASPRKSYIQRVNSGDIQRFYSRHELSKIDLEQLTKNNEKNLSEKEIDSYWNACKTYEKAIQHIKGGHRMRAMPFVLRSWIQSKLMRENIHKAIMFRGFLIKA